MFCLLSTSIVDMSYFHSFQNLVYNYFYSSEILFWQLSIFILNWDFEKKIILNYGQYLIYLFKPLYIRTYSSIYNIIKCRVKK